MRRGWKVHSWNVNGLRSCLEKGFLGYVQAFRPDVLCLQEVRADPSQVESALPDGYTAYWNPAERKGYSGVAIWARRPPLSVRAGMGVPEADAEGRVLTAEWEDLQVVSVYAPNVRPDLSRLRFRAEVWDPALAGFLQTLAKRKPVVFAGDLNVAHQAIDLAHPGPNRGKAGYTEEERAGFERYLKSGFIDTFRVFEPGPGHYSWWSFRARARANNVGWRIDYVMASEDLRPRLAGASILPQVMGSDHCPVVLHLRPPAVGTSPQSPP